MKKSPNSQKGLHLLDLTIAMLIVAVIGAASVPSVRTLLHANDLEREASLLKFRLQSLLTESLLHGHDAAAVFGGSWYKMVPADDKAEMTFELPSSITASLQSQSSQTIKFYKSGVVSPATIEISSPSKKCQLTLSLRGRIEDKCHG